MQRKTLTLFLCILVLAACAGYINWPNNPGLHISWLGISHPLQLKQGLDLQGGIRVLLVPDPAQNYSTETLQREIDATRDQIERRVNGGLGVNEPVIRVQTTNGKPSIAVELPKITSGNQEEAVSTLLKSGNLEFWNTGPAPRALSHQIHHSIRQIMQLTILMARRSLQVKTWIPGKSESVLTSRPGGHKSTSR
jgi:preprotein translocase subunit SecD